MAGKAGTCYLDMPIAELKLWIFGCEELVDIRPLEQNLKQSRDAFHLPSRLSTTSRSPHP